LAVATGSGTYDLAGFPLYIKPNGSNQFLYIPSLALGTTTLFFATGVRKISDAARGMVVENGATTWNFTAPNSAAATNYASSLDTGTNTITTYTAPVTNTISLSLDKTQATVAAAIVAKINGSSPSQASSGGAPSGNFGTSAVYFFARGGTSIFFGGFETVSIGRGASALPSAAQIAATESWVNQKTRAY